jgi:capsular polysaccharide biosynthesis protein
LNEKTILQNIKYPYRVFLHDNKHTLRKTAYYFQNVRIIIGPHGGAFLNMIFCKPGTHVVEIGYDDRKSMHYPSYFFTMARRLDHIFWLIMGHGSYVSNIVAPVNETVSLINLIFTKGSEY